MQTDARVRDVTPDSGPFTRVILDAPEIAPLLAAGRFVMADLGGYVRAPLFPAAPSTPAAEPGAFVVLVPPDHPLTTLRPEASVNLIGPLGHGFEVPPSTHHLLLAADTDHLPMLLPMALEPSNAGYGPGIQVALLLSRGRAEALYPIQLLPPALEVHLVTADGSASPFRSLSAVFPDLVRWADCICIAQDPVTYPALAELVRQVRVRPHACFAQALVVPAVACGVGACQGCAVRVARSTKLACTDGPVFDLLELR